MGLLIDGKWVAKGHDTSATGGRFVRQATTFRRNVRGLGRRGADLASSYPEGHIDDLAAQVGSVLADVFGTELVWRTVEILRQLHADVVRAWLRAPVA